MKADLIDDINKVSDAKTLTNDIISVEASIKLSLLPFSK